MFKKLIFTVIDIFLLSFNANAGSDGELVLKKDQPQEIKDCFEKLNRATFAFNQGLDKSIIKPIAEKYRKLPDPIQKGIYESIERDLNIEPTISNLSRMETILEGTEWENAVKKNTVPKQFDPFAGLDTKGNNDRPATKDLNSLF